MTQQWAVAELGREVDQLTSDLDQRVIDDAVALLDAIAAPVSRADVEALVRLLPADGDDALGLNWTVLHAIESSPKWPVWELLRDDGNEWIETLRLRLVNSGITPP